MSTVAVSSFLHLKNIGFFNSKFGQAADANQTINWLQPKEKVQIENAKMETFYFCNCDQHNPNNFVVASLSSSHKLHGFCISV